MLGHHSLTRRRVFGPTSGQMPCRGTAKSADFRPSLTVVNLKKTRPLCPLPMRCLESQSVTFAPMAQLSYRKLTPCFSHSRNTASQASRTRSAAASAAFFIYVHHQKTFSRGDIYAVSGGNCAGGAVRPLIITGSGEVLSRTRTVVSADRRGGDGLRYSKMGMDVLTGWHRWCRGHVPPIPIILTDRRCVFSER